MSDTNTTAFTTLQKTHIFVGLYKNHLEFICQCGTVENFNKNEQVIQEGQTPKALYIVITGQLEVVLPTETDKPEIERLKEVELNKLIKGQCAGEYSLIDNKPASASVIATEPSKLFRITKEAFKKITDSDDYVAKTIYHNMLQLMIDRLRSNNDELGLLVFNL